MDNSWKQPLVTAALVRQQLEFTVLMFTPHKSKQGMAINGKS